MLAVFGQDLAVDDGVMHPLTFLKEARAVAGKVVHGVRL
jgi:hypothetical protein